MKKAKEQIVTARNDAKAATVQAAKCANDKSTTNPKALAAIEEAKAIGAKGGSCNSAAKSAAAAFANEC